MKVHGRKVLYDFVHRYPDVESQVDAWLVEATSATWANPVELTARYPSASIFKSGGCVFNLKGNKYRLHTLISYKNQVIMVVQIGTHKQYAKWNLED